MLVRTTDLDALAADIGLPSAIIRHYAELGLIRLTPVPSAVDLRELRCARRLVEDLGLDYDGAEVVLRLRQRILALQREVARLEAELRARSDIERTGAWVDGEWLDL
jgi:uncharacterized small protein (DUF1192 family)